MKVWQNYMIAWAVLHESLIVLHESPAGAAWNLDSISWKSRGTEWKSTDESLAELHGKSDGAAWTPSGTAWKFDNTTWKPCINCIKVSNSTAWRLLTKSCWLGVAHPVYPKCDAMLYACQPATVVVTTAGQLDRNAWLHGSNALLHGSMIRQLRNDAVQVKDVRGVNTIKCECVNKKTTIRARRMFIS